MRDFFALLFYRLILLSLTPLLLLALLLRSKSQPEYRRRIKERLGFLTNKFEQHGIVVHAASVGEVVALTPFVKQLISLYPDCAITVTTFTPTGSEQVKNIFKDSVQHCYLPLDNYFSCYLFLRKLKPKALIVMETELWPELISQCSSKGIKLLLLNGRMSKKSLKQYLKFSWLLKPTLQRFDQLLLQSDIDQQHYLVCGAEQGKCEISGNVKFDINISSDVATKQQVLTAFLEGKRKIWLVASTHHGDEEIALNAFQEIKKHDPQALLIIVPRHPERFQQVVNLAQDAGNHVVQRSQNQPVTLTDNIWVIDTLGELLATCSLADVVTMGGSFNEIGGHNPLEPAFFQKPIVVGANMSNFKEINEQMLKHNGIIQLSEDDIPTQLAEHIIKLFNNPALAHSLGKNAHQVVKANQGATKLSLDVFDKLIS